MDPTRTTELLAAQLAPRPAPRRRPPAKALVQLLRRLHLYAGLLMLPWVILYGVTAFLFNHPTAFSDQPIASFGPEAVRGTALENPPSPAALAAEVVAALQNRATGGAEYALVEPNVARYTREFAFATVQAGGRELSLLWDVAGGGGTIRSRPAPAAKTADARAPFAVGGPAPATPRPAGARSGDALKLPAPLHERFAAAIPGLLERHGFPQGEVAVTSVPDLAFRMADAGGAVWAVTYNAQTGVVSGKPAGAAPAEGGELSARRFLLRLHTAHGYPATRNARWAWAVVVDVMAGVMLFWGLSGLLMWWQIRATRTAGALVLAASAAAAVWMGVGMHELLSMAGR